MSAKRPRTRPIPAKVRARSLFNARDIHRKQLAERVREQIRAGAPGVRRQRWRGEYPAGEVGWSVRLAPDDLEQLEHVAKQKNMGRGQLLARIVDMLSLSATERGRISPY